jgi:hypothetical protein
VKVPDHSTDAAECAVSGCHRSEVLVAPVNGLARCLRHSERGESSYGGRRYGDATQESWKAVR